MRKRIFCIIFALIAFMFAASLTASADTYYGDVNLDDSIDSSDALLVIRYSIDLTSLNNEQFLAADVNCDNVVDSSDALIILRVAVGTISENELTGYQKAISSDDDHTFTKEKEETREFIQKVFELANAERVKEGCQPCLDDPELDRLAYMRTEEMEILNSHTRPNGMPCETILKENNYYYIFTAENIGVGYVSPEEVIQGWLDSPEHKLNLLGKNYNRLGSACRILVDENGHKRYFWAQIFAKVATPIADEDKVKEEKVKEEIVTEINTARLNQGLYSLRRDSWLDGIAQIRANDMTIKESYSERPDGTDWKQLLYDDGFYGHCANMPCIGRNKETAAEIYTTLNDQSSKKVPSFLDTKYDYTRIGVGHVYIEGSRDAHYWVIVIATENE